ncbi:hypothetical protein GF312_20575 [Candidatus Poribacteria bacterium]|nr:hypothetical protein [Candidatus Poribacteria bacterium]
MSKATGFVTLTTDFGLSDGFVGIMKGVIYSINPSAKLIDISHDIASQDIQTASFILGSAFSFFPKGTVHMVVVDPGVGSDRSAVAVETDNYYFVAPDNGVLSGVMERISFIKVMELSNKKHFLPEVSNTFHGRDIFAPVSAYLSKGLSIDELGTKIENLMERVLPEPEINQDSITGEIIHIDKFGNLISNIDKKSFEKLVVNRDFTIEIAGDIINHLSRSYADSSTDKLLAIFDSFGKLEIAANQNRAADILRVHRGEPIRVVMRR